MTRITHWIFVRPRTGDENLDDFVRWRHFRRYRAVMIRGVLFIIAAQIFLAGWIYHAGETGRHRIERAAYQNCVNIEALRQTQRDALMRSLKSYERPDVRKLLGPKLIALGRRQIRERLAELKPIDCRARASQTIPHR